MVKGWTRYIRPSHSNMSRIAVIFGATGTQGSAVIDCLLADKNFTPRAVTRNASSEAAKKLAARGVEVVTADLWDKDSIDRALAGSEVVFGVTNYYDPTIAGSNIKGEVIQGKIMIDAAKKAGVKFFIWSGLPRPNESSKGKYSVELYDNKVEVGEYLKQSGLPNAILYTGWFCENLWNFDYLTKAADGSYELVVPRYSPNSPNAILWVKNLGLTVVALLKHYTDRADEVLNNAFYVANANMTYPDFAKILSNAIGKPVKFVSSATSGLRELDIMYEYSSDQGLYRHVTLPDPRLVALGVEFGTLEEFAEKVAKPRYA